MIGLRAKVSRSAMFIRPRSPQTLDNTGGEVASDVSEGQSEPVLNLRRTMPVGSAVRTPAFPCYHAKTRPSAFDAVDGSPPTCGYGRGARAGGELRWTTLRRLVWISRSQCFKCMAWMRWARWSSEG